MAKSKHIAKKLTTEGGIHNVQVLFADIEKYSLRNTKTQSDVVEAFTKIVKETRNLIANKYANFEQ